jgi:hypothetical protein
MDTAAVVPGRFGPSRKKEAAARRFGNYELWVFECRYGPDNAGWRQDAREILSLAAGVITAAGSPGAERGTRRRSQALDVVDEHTSSEACQRARRRDESAVSL